VAGSVNKAIIIGNLGADPEVRQTQGGQAVATLSIATSDTYTDREGQRQERTEWHRVVCFGKLAELAQRYLAKGRKVFVEGRIQTRSWDDQQTGQKRYSTEIVARELTFLDSGRDAGARTGGPGPAPAHGGSERQPGGPPAQPAWSTGFSQATAPAGPPPPPAGGPPVGPPGDPGYFNDDDLPF
jgi:single-strand DNA-binding protein